MAKKMVGTFSGRGRAKGATGTVSRKGRKTTIVLRPKGKAKKGGKASGSGSGDSG